MQVRSKIISEIIKVLFQISLLNILTRAYLISYTKKIQIIVNPHNKIIILAYNGTKLRSFNVTRPNKNAVTPDAIRKNPRKLIFAKLFDGKLKGKNML